MRVRCRARKWLAVRVVPCLLIAPVSGQAAEINLPLTVRFELLLQQLTQETVLRSATVRSERALERGDAFLVFVIKNLGLDIADPGIRAELFGLLIESRYELLPILAGNVQRSAGDPVRRLFTEVWKRFHDIMDRAERRGLLRDRALRYAGFIGAGDALVALDRAAPGLGIELSADGLRRLARLLRPEATDDPLRYNVDVDSTLRSLFGLPPESDLAPTPAPPPTSPGRGSALPWRPVAYVATAEGGEDLRSLNERLARWVPDDLEGGAPWQGPVGRLSAV